MLTGQKPTEVTVRAFDASLALYAEHELNASTFTTRVIAATLSDEYGRWPAAWAPSRARCTAAPARR